jgi:hypothetical protein
LVCPSDGVGINENPARASGLSCDKLAINSTCGGARNRARRGRC